MMAVVSTMYHQEMSSFRICSSGISALKELKITRKQTRLLRKHYPKQVEITGYMVSPRHMRKVHEHQVDHVRTTCDFNGIWERLK